MTQEKAKYRVLRLSFIGNQLLDEGAEVEYDGEPGSALEPLNDAAEAAKKKAMKKHAHSAYDVNPTTVNVLDGGSNEVSSGAISDDLASLRQQYEDLFNEKPGNMKAETLKERIADKRKELGV
ncbi:hypothetical protein [Atlantibacter hermannii]|uniref:hypothetical protein n=1 Tax=Atlantibacter hermannii TaxID=565 RepID=UPI00296F3E98|nr:hypothetical protein [Atlantibacter hermannii]MDW4578482.1 hypothetical protein [Atlantibacter hermannii]